MQKLKISSITFYMVYSEIIDKYLGKFGMGTELLQEWCASTRLQAAHTS